MNEGLMLWNKTCATLSFFFLAYATIEISF